MQTLKDLYRSWKRPPHWLYAIPALLLTFYCKVLCRRRMIDHSGYLPDPHRVIGIAWHNRLFSFPVMFPSSICRNTVAVVSASRDGQYVTDMISYFGIGGLRGSSQKGGAHAQLGAIRELENGKIVIFTPDGPRGPKYHMDRGPVHLASTCQAEIVPLSINASRYWQVKSWDNFQIPKPFSTLTLVLGEPIQIPLDLTSEELEKYRKIVEAALMQITQD